MKPFQVLMIILAAFGLSCGGCNDSTSNNGNNANNGNNSNNGNNANNENNSNNANNALPTFEDEDGDGVPNGFDNCALEENGDQADADSDGIGDVCDNCINTSNFDQGDEDGDGQGDACEDEPAGPICAMQESEFERLKPNIYIVVDRSTSMQNTDGGATTRMERARAGLDLIAQQLFDDLRLGISTYPCGNQNDACELLNVELLSIGDYTAPEIQASYNAGYTDATCPYGASVDIGPGLDIEEGGRHCTETGSALEDVLTRGLASDPADPQDAQRERAVVLITDGGACGCGAQPFTVAQAAALNAANVPVYVVGFNTTAQLTTQLDEVAMAGGTDAGAAGSPLFYEAANAQDLADVLQNINSLTIPCSFVLAPPPEDPNRIWVSIEGMFIAEEAMDGYAYDAMTNTLTLNGASCDQLRAADPNNPPLQIISGCAGATCDEVGEQCGANADCCNAICEGDICVDACFPAGTPCREDTDCCAPSRCAKAIGDDTGICAGG